MNIKQKMYFVIAGLLISTGLLLSPSPAVALEKCADIDTAIIKCDPKINNRGGLETNGVWGLLLIALNILTAGVGLVAVGGIVYGSILYTSAGDKAEQVKKAIGVITNVVIGIVAYIGMFAFLQFIIPGGVF